MRATATKAGRLNIQNIEFETLIKKGYSRENYGDLKIFVMIDETSTWLKIYKGTAAKESIYKRYRTEEQATEAIKNAKASHDRSKAYKAELKANPLKSSHSNCAAAIREELKKVMPQFKFSVRSESFSGGDAVRISWENGPTVGQVEEITNKYAYGRFDSMTDYSYSEHTENLPQAKYVTTYREFNEELKEAVKNDLLRLRPELDHHGYDNVNDHFYRILRENEIPLNAVFLGLIPRTESDPHSNEFFKLSFEVTEAAQTEVKESANFEAVEVPAGEVQIIDYSEKSIAVIGDTKPIKDQLKEIGGKFNFRLSCGPGWIFSKKQLPEVEKLLSGGAIPEEAEEPEQEEEKIFDGSKNENGAFNIPGHLTVYDHSGRDITNTFKKEVPTLKDEIQETVNFLAELDLKNTGQVSESVKECARVQEVEIYSNLEDINEAAESGKVISLFNLSKLVNQ